MLPAGTNRSARWCLLLPALAIAQACSGPEGQLKAEAEKSVRELLRDPESARFSYGVYPLVFPNEGLVCGEVNAKNAYGGYAGDEMFAYARGSGAALVGDPYGGFRAIHERCLAAQRARTEEIRKRTARMKGEAYRPLPPEEAPALNLGTDNPQRHPPDDRIFRQDASRLNWAS